MDLNLLIVFEALLEERSVTRAARRIGLSQPAFSNALARLREQIGDQLFERSHRGMLPTTRALDIATLVRPALDQVRRALEPVPAITRTSELSGEVAVGLESDLQVVLLPRLLNRIEREAPGINIEIRTLGRPTRALAQLRDARIDLVVDASEIGMRRDFHQVELFEERYVCLVRKGLTPGSGRLTEELFSVLNHVMSSGMDPERQPAERAIMAAGLKRRASVVVPGMLAAPWVVAQSDSVAVVPARLAEWFVTILPLEVLEPPVPLPPAKYVLRWHRRSEQNRAAAFIRQKLTEVGAEIAQAVV